MKLSAAVEAEIRIEKDYRQMILTSSDRSRYLKIARYLGDSPATSTYMVALHLRKTCSVVRRDLRKMEKLDYVTADSNGSNNIYWALRP